MQLSDFHFSDLIVKVVSAIVILIVTGIIARLVKSVLTKQLVKIPALHRQGDGGESLAVSLGTIVSLVVWLFGLMAILNLFALTSVLTPIQGLLNTLLAALPKVIGAGLVLFIGVVVGKIVRELVVTALQATKLDSYAERLGGGNNATTRTQAEGEHGATSATASSSGTPRLSTMIGQLLFVVIVLVVGISALQVLGISAISDPATQMLSMILNAIPAIIGALILLGIGVLIARFVGGLLESLLRGMGLDRAAKGLGIDTNKTNVSSIITRVAQIAIVLFFAIAAANMLGSPQISSILNAILGIGGQVVFGAIVIAAGVWIAGLLANMLSGQTATIVRYATIVLFVAMGLKFMGLADSIVNLAFGALVVGAAAAAALAFGLGGREAAGRQLQRLQGRSGDVTTRN